jgi:hypothetical protein
MPTYRVLLERLENGGEEVLFREIMAEKFPRLMKMCAHTYRKYNICQTESFKSYI